MLSLRVETICQFLVSFLANVLFYDAMLNVDQQEYSHDPALIINESLIMQRQQREFSKTMTLVGDLMHKSTSCAI